MVICRLNRHMLYTVSQLRLNIRKDDAQLRTILQNSQNGLRLLQETLYPNGPASHWLISDKPFTGIELHRL